MQPQRDPPDQRERAAGAAHQLAKVVAGDVLHDLAPRARHRPVTEHQRHPEHEVARRSEPVAKRARERRGDAGPDRGVTRRVERESLAGRRQRSLERREPDARLDGAGEIARLVLEDPVEPGRVELLADRDGRAACARPPRGSRLTSSSEVGRTALETVCDTDELQRVGAMRAGYLAAEPRRREHLAGVGDALRVEGEPQAARTSRDRGRRTTSAWSRPCRRRPRARR